ncbi:MAG: hypothetical protein QE263_06080 [Vampirovibrionales bacterium]|nr:hypothetical protein [Vampirovibrionales bacterium]
MSVTLPIANNDYIQLMASLAQQSPNKVVENIPGAGVGSQTAQNVKNVWQNGLPQTGNEVVDTLVVNRVNNTVAATKKSVSQVKDYSLKGLLIGALWGLKVQAGLTLVPWVRETRRLMKEPMAFKQAAVAAWKLLREQRFFTRNIGLTLPAFMAVFGLIGLGIGLGIALLKSVGRAKQLLWGQPS